ncbi:MAG TPA: helix-turn-helix transcriptional regulator [Bacteriovoracaceae bacterium]|nr:helix-turn-helix transcriptional regulator [Bacteriovoracaceae bacterium]
MKLSNKIKLLRQQHGDISQQQLAEMVGCSRQTIISIESGCKNPSVEIALKLSLALKTPVDELFALEEGKEKETICKRISDFFTCPLKKRREKNSRPS